MTNQQQEHYQIIQLIEGIIRNGYSRKIATEASSYEFALSALKAALFINAGALVALPAYKSAVSNIHIFLPSALFSLGIICAAISLFLAYLNLQHYSELHHIDENSRASKILLDYEKKMGLPTRERENNIKNYKITRTYYERRVILYLWGAIIFGSLSYLLFISGFVFSAKEYFFSALY